MRRVARREIGADGEARHRAGEFRQRRFEAGEVEFGGAAVHVVSAGAEHHRILPECCLQPVAFEVGLGEADHDERHAAALALDQRVGGKRGRHRGELDRRRVDLGFGQHPVDRARNADREVVAGGQRLRLGDDGSGRVRGGAFGPQHRVGVGAAGVYAEEEGAEEAGCGVGRGLGHVVRAGLRPP